MKALVKYLPALALLFVGVSALAQAPVAPNGGLWNVQPDLAKIQEVLDNATVASKRAVTTQPQFFDVVGNGQNFQFVGDTDENGFLIPGSHFIISGHVYPGGTLFNMGPSEAGDFPYGALEDGSPEFPDLVIGTWMCQGSILINSFGAITSYTTQQFNFFQDPNAPDAEGFLSVGQEPFSMATITRSVVGGMGSFSRTHTDLNQLVIAPVNASLGANFFMIMNPPYTVNFKQDQ